MLQPQFEADFRVVLLTDGENNAGVSQQAAVQAAFEIGAVVDAIIHIVGEIPDTNLRKIVAATGGNCYQIMTLGESFELMEAESVVSLKKPVVVVELTNRSSSKGVQTRNTQYDTSTNHCAR